MPEFDHGVKMIADTTSRELARVAGVECGRLEPLESTLLTTVELLADRAFRARNGRERFILYFEFFTRWDRNAPWDLLAKAGLLSQREHLPTLCAVFILHRRGYRPQRGRFRLQTLGQTTQQLRFKERCLWKITPQPWWTDVPGLMALYPLCRHRRPPREAVKYASNVIERTVAGEVERADRLFLLDIFGSLAYPRLDVAGIIGREKMQGSRFGQEMRQEGQREGDLRTLRKNLLKVLRQRFGSAVASELAPAVNAKEDLEFLERLFDQALAGVELSEVRTALQVGTG